MANKTVISLTTGLEDSETVTVAFLVSVGAVGQEGEKAVRGAAGPGDLRIG